MENLHYQWYIILVKSGTEEKIIADIKFELEQNNNKKWQNYVRDWKSTKLLKGYIFCYCFLNTELVNFFSKIEGVRGFLNYQKGEQKLPEPISEERVNNFFSQLRLKEKKPLTILTSNLNIGDLVKITKGVFLNCEGKITYLDNKKQKVRIAIKNKQWEVTDIPIVNCQKILV